MKIAFWIISTLNLWFSLLVAVCIFALIVFKQNRPEIFESGDKKKIRTFNWEKDLAIVTLRSSTLHATLSLGVFLLYIFDWINEGAGAGALLFNLIYGAYNVTRNRAQLIMLDDLHYGRMEKEEANAASL